MLPKVLLDCRTAVIKQAVDLIPSVGFSDDLLDVAFARAADDEAKKVGCSADKLGWSTQMVAATFERGFPIAMVEHLALLSNRHVFSELEGQYSKNVVISTISKQANTANAKSGQGARETVIAAPAMKNVVEFAICEKLRYLRPYAGRWGEAVALEYRPQNIPYAVVSLAEFSDTVSYYGERVDTLKTVLDAGNAMFDSRIGASVIFPDDSTTRARSAEEKIASGISNVYGNDREVFLRAFCRNIPLSGGPHLGGGFLDFGWFSSRSKVSACYGAAMTSLIGEHPRGSKETEELVKQMAKYMF